MDAFAVILERPETLALDRLPLTPAVEGDAVVAVSWSGISTGTERLLWSGRMPPFPGMGYPLVPGYESVGTVIEAGPEAGIRVGQTVFVPGARCFGPVRGLFGGAASHLIAPA
ncbi:alcohol dehydrogenase catalytic domain-containing protein, partial [Methylobacterium trifolii]